MDSLPIGRASTLPAKYYLESEVHAFDCEHILKANWQYIGHATQIPRAGDYLVAQWMELPIIVVRQSDGKSIRGFYNVCRHRGGPLATTSGHARILRCQYHHWSYSLAGELLGTPRTKQIEDFDRATCKLPEVAIAEYHGLLFAGFGSMIDPNLSAYAGIAEEIDPLSLDSLVFGTRTSYTIDCNWKMYVDNFMEGYHIDAIHPELAAVLNTDGYTTTVSGQRVLQRGPIRPDKPNPYQTSHGEAFYYFVFPNTMLNILPGRVQVNTIIPASPTRCQVIFDYYYATARDVAERLQSDVEFSDLVQKQDIDICERVQANLAAKTYHSGRYAPEEELGLFAFHELLRAAYRSHLCGK
jgi:choline monooxygenase